MFHLSTMLETLDVVGTQLMHAGCVFALRPKACLPACPRSVQALLHSGSGGLAGQFGRTEKSFKFRMQNISAGFFNAGAGLADGP